jgi:nucleotide-binding universal stress UspA family protein
MYKKILVPLDGSELSEHALAHLRAIAGGPKTLKVVLLQVVEPVVIPLVGGQYAVERALEERERGDTDAKNYLNELAEQLEKEGMSVKTVITHGMPADDILNYATKNKVGLIIMSTHGRSGISRWLFGSVAEKVIRHSTIPVLVSPPHGTRGG